MPVLAFCSILPLFPFFFKMGILNFGSMHFEPTEPTEIQIFLFLLLDVSAYAVYNAVGKKAGILSPSKNETEEKL